MEVYELEAKYILDRKWSIQHRLDGMWTDPSALPGFSQPMRTLTTDRNNDFAQLSAQDQLALYGTTA